MRARYGHMKSPSRLVTNGLVMHLDAGDIASAASSSAQTWVDLTGNSNSFYRGESGSSAGDDPTLNGTPGGLSGGNYYSFDGGDYFTQASGSADTFLRQIGRQDTAFTLEFWVYLSSVASKRFFATNYGSAEVGCNIGTDGTGKVLAVAYTSSEMQTGTTVLSANTWYQVVVAGRFNGGQGIQLFLNGSSDSSNNIKDNWYWTSGDATELARMGVRYGANSGTGGPDLYFANGSRLAIVRAYNRVLTATEISSNFNNNRGRFSI